MQQQVLEGTWEEVRAHDPELTGQHVRLIILPPAWLNSPPQTPPVIFDPSSDSILTDEIRAVLDPFIELLIADIQEHAIDASKIEIWGTEDPEGAAVRLWCYCGSTVPLTTKCGAIMRFSTPAWTYG